MPHNKILMQPIESLLFNSIPKTTKILMPKRNSTKSMKPTITWETTPEGVATTLCYLDKLLLSEPMTSLKIFGLIDGMNWKKKLILFSGHYWETDGLEILTEPLAYHGSMMTGATFEKENLKKCRLTTLTGMELRIRRPFQPKLDMRTVFLRPKPLSNTNSQMERRKWEKWLMMEKEMLLLMSITSRRAKLCPLATDLICIIVCLLFFIIWKLQI